MHPRVSVIVPTYNRCKSVRTAVNSILTQSFKDFEVIVIDDGSIDDTKEVLSSYQNSNFRYFYQENQGLPAAWNAGIEKSRGKFIAFLDSDDYWLEDKLQIQVAFLEETKQQYHGCVSGYLLHTLNGEEKTIIPSLTDASLRAILWKNILHLGTTFMCPRTVFHEIGFFDENLRRGQDTDWMIRYRKRFKVGVVPQTLAVFNQHLSRSGEIMENSRLFFLKKHRSDLLEQGAFFYRRKAATTYTDLAYQFYREGNTTKARKYSWKALFTFPLLWPGLYLILLDVHIGTQFKKMVDQIKYPKVFK